MYTNFFRNGIIYESVFWAIVPYMRRRGFWQCGDCGFGGDFLFVFFGEIIMGEDGGIQNVVETDFLCVIFAGGLWCCTNHSRDG